MPATTLATPCRHVNPEGQLQSLKLVSYTAYCVERVLIECAARGWYDPPIRYIAARVKRCKEQVIRLIKELVCAGRLVRQKRKACWNRYKTNLYRVVGLKVDPGDINATEKQELTLKTNTPPREAAGPISEMKRKWEERKAQDAHDHKQKRRELSLIAQIRALRALLRSRNHLPSFQPICISTPDDQVPASWKEWADNYNRNNSLQGNKQWQTG